MSKDDTGEPATSDDTDAPGTESDPLASGSSEAPQGQVGGKAAPTFTPPSFLDAIKTVFQPKGPRARAQPATGSDEDARRVNYIDKRETFLAGFLALFEMAIGVTVFLYDRRLVVSPSNKRPKVSVAQAHKDTLSYHHLAPEALIVNVALGLLVGGAVWSRRRAFVGFTILFSGLALGETGGGIIGIGYLGVGIWMVFRAMRKTKDMRPARATAGAGPGRDEAVPGRPTGGRPSRAQRAAPEVRKPAPASKRYTPPSPRKPGPPRPAPGSEPEKESRLTSWLRR